MAGSIRIVHSISKQPLSTIPGESRVVQARTRNQISKDKREVASRALGHVHIVVERITVDARAYVRKSCWHLDTRFLSLFTLHHPLARPRNVVVKYFTGKGGGRGGLPVYLRNRPCHYIPLKLTGFSSQMDRISAHNCVTSNVILSIDN